MITAAGDKTSTSGRTSALLARALRFGDGLVRRAVFADFVGYIKKKDRYKVKAKKITSLFFTIIDERMN